MSELRSGLFVDFENVFAGLMGIDPDTALGFAGEPTPWLERLGHWGLDDGHRRLLLRRLYLDPNGYLPNEEHGNDAGRLYYSRLTPGLIRAGFELVACPPLTGQLKNAADIRIVIDVLGLLAGENRLDEIVIVSSDADFTPLLHVLGAADVRSVIVSASPSSPAFRAVADQVIGQDDMLALLGAGLDADCSSDAVPIVEAATRIVQRVADEAAGPVSLAAAGNLVIRELGSDVKQGRYGRWLGHGNMSDFIRTLATSDGHPFEVDRGYFWDPRRHCAPDDSPPPVDGAPPDDSAAADDSLPPDDGGPTRTVSEPYGQPGCGAAGDPPPSPRFLPRPSPSGSDPGDGPWPPTPAR